MSSTLARTNGARAAAAALNVKLVEQYSGWDPQKMIDQFKEAVAAKPDGIEIMGHPGGDAFAALVDDAESQGIIVNSQATTRAMPRSRPSCRSINPKALAMPVPTCTKAAS